MQKSKQGGITLIALIITIIVMLILVGVTVNVALNGGLFTKAIDASKRTQLESDRERLQVAAAGTMGNDGKVNFAELNVEAEALGFSTVANGKYTKNGNTFIVSENGSVTASEGEETLQPSDQKYFTYTFNEDDKTATITGVAEKYQEKWMYGDYSAITCIKDGDSYIKDVVLPSTVTNNGETYTVTKIGNEAFANYYRQWADENEIQNGFTSFVIPDTVIEIGEYAFNYQRKLTNITIPNSVTSIGYAAFHSCNSLTNITIPNSVTSIGEYVFWDCTSLTNITIPNSVTSIGEYVFSNCTSLKNVTIGNGVTSIEENAFSECSSITNINVDENNTNYSSKDGVLFNKEKTRLIKYPVANLRTSYSIPNSVTSIGDYAFYKCTSLTNVTIGNGVTSIGYAAFHSCNRLTNITIGNNVTSIGAYAFSYCTSLTNITIPDSVTSIGEHAFIGSNSDLQIKCIASSKPSGWNFDWNRKSWSSFEVYTPIWGYTGE